MLKTGPISIRPAVKDGIVQGTMTQNEAPDSPRTPVSSPVSSEPADLDAPEVLSIMADALAEWRGDARADGDDFEEAAFLLFALRNRAMTDQAKAAPGYPLPLDLAGGANLSPERRAEIIRRDAEFSDAFVFDLPDGSDYPHPLAAVRDRRALLGALLEAEKRERVLEAHLRAIWPRVLDNMYGSHIDAISDLLGITQSSEDRKDPSTP